MAARDRRKALTEKQRGYLWRLAWSWRRQLLAAMVELAGLYSGCTGFANKSGKIAPLVS